MIARMRIRDYASIVKPDYDSDDRDDDRSTR